MQINRAKLQTSDPLVFLLDTNIAMEEEIQESTAIASMHNLEAVDRVLIKGVICERRLQVNEAATSEPIIVAMKISTTKKIMMPGSKGRNWQVV